MSSFFSNSNVPSRDGAFYVYILAVITFRGAWIEAQDFGWTSSVSATSSWLLRSQGVEGLF